MLLSVGPAQHKSVMGINGFILASPWPALTAEHLTSVSGFLLSILHRRSMRVTSTALLTCSTCGQRRVSASTSDRLADGPRYSCSCARRPGTCSHAHSRHSRQAAGWLGGVVVLGPSPPLHVLCGTAVPLALPEACCTEGRMHTQCGGRRMHALTHTRPGRAHWLKAHDGQRCARKAARCANKVARWADKAVRYADRAARCADRAARCVCVLAEPSMLR